MARAYGWGKEPAACAPKGAVIEAISPLCAATDGRVTAIRLTLRTGDKSLWLDLGADQLLALAGGMETEADWLYRALGKLLEGPKAVEQLTHEVKNNG